MPKPGPRTTYKYSDEFKSTAVRLSQLPGVEVNKEVVEDKEVVDVIALVVVTVIEVAVVGVVVVSFTEKA